MMLKIDSLSKSFGDKTVLDSFSHEFKDSSVTLITGQSGAGKTTLLRIIAGLETPDSGSVMLDGQVVSMMFQEARLLPWKTVCENLYAVTERKDRDTVLSFLDELGLAGEWNRMPHELSGGMRRRVSIARALLFPADIYLFDEPFAGLDCEMAKQAADVILGHTKDKTVLIVSHDRSMLPNNIDTIVI